MNPLRLMCVLLLLYGFLETDSVPVSENIVKDSKLDSNKELYLNVVRRVRDAEHDQEKGDDSQVRDGTSSELDSREKAEKVSTAKSSSGMTLTMISSTITNPPTTSSCSKGVDTRTPSGRWTDANGCIIPTIDVCPNGFGYYQHINPEKFCQCAWGTLNVMPCAPATAWDQAILTCTHACYQQITGVEPSRATGWKTDTNGCIIPIIDSDVCPNGFGYYQNINPEKFCQCVWRILYVMPCAAGTAWNQALLTCAHANDRQPTVSSTPGTTSTRTSRTTIYQSTSSKNECDSGQIGWRTEVNGCIIPVIDICPNGFGYYEHINREKFCQCSFQKLYVMPCAPGTSWDQAILTCTQGKYQERIGSCSIGDLRTTASGDLMVCVYITNSAGQIVRDWKYCGKNEGSSPAKENDGITSSTTRSTSGIPTVTNTTPSTTNSTTNSKPSTTSTIINTSTSTKSSTTIVTPSTTSSRTNTTRGSTTSAKPSTERLSTKLPTCGSAPNVTGLLVVTPGAANANDKKVYRCNNPDETFPRNVFNPDQCPVITCLPDGTYDKSFNSKAKTCEALPNSPPGDDTQTSPGTITSPGFDGTSPYRSTKASYRWNIVTTGSQIIFNITTFDVRNGNNQCNNGDRLEIFCGFKDSSREFKFCSGSTPVERISCSVGCAGVVFVVDNKTTSKGVGFSLSWTN